MIEKPSVIDSDKLPITVPGEKDFDGKEFLDAPELSKIVSSLLSDKPEFAHLDDIALVTLWKQSGGKHHGKMNLGKMSPASSLVHHFSEADYIVWLAADHLAQYGETKGMLPRKFAEALLYHELCHLSWDAEKGEVVMVGHDFEGFQKELEVYGAWKADLAELKQTMKQLKML